MGQGSGTPAVSDCHAHLQCLILPSLRDRERLKWAILYIEARVYTSWMFINFMYIYTIALRLTNEVFIFDFTGMIVIIRRVKRKVDL